MKTLILYTSKYGFTEDCVRKLSSRLTGEVVAVDAAKAPMPDPAAFDAVIVGGPVYMGRIPKALSACIQANLGRIRSRRLGLFLCCGLPDQFSESLKAAFPSELLAEAASVQCFGGELRTERMKGMDRMISGVMAKADKGKGEGLPAERLEAIIRMADEINQLQRREQI